MNDSMRPLARSFNLSAIAVLLASASGTVMAQTSAPALLGATVASDPNPYFIGANQGFTYQSNATRGQSGSSASSSDTVSSTSLLAGFNQPIGRQRVFGRASVSENRYFSNSSLNNTGYDLSAGLDWATVADLSGGINVGASRSLTAPIAFTAFGATTPTTTRNLARTETIDARAAWGGASVLSVDGSVGHSKVDYSAPQYVSSNLTQDRASIGLHYNPGGPLRLGIAGRETRTRTPQAVPVSLNGPFEANTTTGKNIDFLADYRLTGIVGASGRLSRTRQTNSNPSLAGANFSGVTGNLNVSYQATGKTSLNGYVSRDVGFNSSLLNTFTATQVGVVTVLSPLTGLYQTNQLTDAIGIDASYLATGKITARAGIRYSRARSLSSIAGGGSTVTLPATTDRGTFTFLGATWAIERNLSLFCNLAHESRNVSGDIAYAYTNNSIGCSAQYTWP